MTAKAGLEYAVSVVLRTARAGGSLEELRTGLASKGWGSVDDELLTSILQSTEAAYLLDGRWYVDSALVDGNVARAVLLDAASRSHRPVGLASLVDALGDHADVSAVRDTRVRFIERSGALRAIGQLGYVPARRTVLPDLATTRARTTGVMTARRLESGELDDLESWHEVRARTVLALASPTLDLMTFDVRGSDVSVHISPVALDGGAGLAAWTSPLDEQSWGPSVVEGWWMWPADDAGVLSVPAALADEPVAVEPHRYRGAVHSENVADVADLAVRYVEALATGRLARARATLVFRPVEGATGRHSARAYVRSQLRATRPVLGYCWRCNSELENPQSARRGLGPDCYNLMRNHLRSEALLDEAIGSIHRSDPQWDAPLSDAELASRIRETDLKHQMTVAAARRV